jgi:hypothetical protein
MLNQFLLGTVRDQPNRLLMACVVRQRAAVVKEFGRLQGQQRYDIDTTATILNAISD